MAFLNWFSQKTRLQLALERGMKPSSSLLSELSDLEDYPVKSTADAEAICDVLEQITPEESAVGGDSGLRAIVGLFQDVDGTECPAYEIMAERGLPLLIAIVDRALSPKSTRNLDDVIFALKVLAMYGTPEGTDAVIRAARTPLKPESYWWSVVLKAYTENHSERQRLYQELSDPLPTDFLAVALLDSATTAQLAGVKDRHPFDSSQGVQQLERWLTDGNEEHFSYAVSAASTLAFIKHEHRDPLLAIALDHPSNDVQLEAAWATAKLGRAAGIQWLVRACHNVNCSEKAQTYLTELGHADKIPADCNDANFRAKAEFAQWLAYPTELGRPPDELEIIDHRELFWPPAGERKSLWLIQYRVKDEGKVNVGVGLVGSVTFCLFSYQLEQRTPEDGYAIHCYWELCGAKLIAEHEVSKESSEYDGMLRQYNLDGLSQIQIIRVAELSPELKYPQQLVGLATAVRQGEEGWVVLDGPRSGWYGKSTMPPDPYNQIPLMIHVGRTMLNFPR